MALRTLPALPTNIMALPTDVKITARSLKPAKLFFSFSFGSFDMCYDGVVATVRLQE